MPRPLPYRFVATTILTTILLFSLAGPAHAVVVTRYAFDGDLQDTAGGGGTADHLSVFGGGTESYAPGILGQAVRIDTAGGAAHRLRAAHSGDLGLAGDFTIEAYVKPDSNNTGEWDRFLTKWADGGNDWHWAFRRANNGLDFFENGTQRFDGGTNAAQNTVPLDIWSHVAVVGDSGTNTITGYINGDAVVSSAYVAPTANGGALNFGNFQSPANGLQFTGMIDDAQIHDTALTVTQLQQRAAALLPGVEPGPASGLVSYYPFDGDTLDQAMAFSQNTGVSADDLTPRGGTANFVAGQVDQALRVGVSAGDTTDLVAALSPDVSLPAAYAIEAWINPSDLGGPWQRLVLNWGAQMSYHFAIRDVGGVDTVSLFHQQSNGANINIDAGSVVANEWQHIAGVADGTNLNVYLNGVLVGSTPYDGTINLATTEGLGIGDSASSLSTIKFNGLLDDLAIWAVPLTPEQVNNHYLLGLQGLPVTTNSAVPEPATASLALLGVLALARRRRRTM